REAGAPPDPAALKRKIGGILPAELAVLLGTGVAIGIFMLVVQHNKVALYTLAATGILALAYLLYEAFRSPMVERHRLFVVLILFFFSMLFWAFFEQAGSSINNFTDRNVDRTFEDRTLTAAEVGSEIRFRVPLRTADPELSNLPILSQEQLGHRNGNPSMNETIEKAIRSEEAVRGKLEPNAVNDLVRQVIAQPTLTMTALTTLRSAAGREGAPADVKTVTWTVVPENVGMGIASAEMPASEFQAANAVFILIFGLVFSALWTFLGTRGLEPSTPFKFSLGLLQLGLGFAAFWYGSQRGDARGMTAIAWLLLGYLLHTTGELCLSPVGLSMVTKLSPTRIVSTVMGSWFLATAFSNYLAGVIAAFTGVSGSEGEQIIPAPIQTVHVYGGVFGKIAITAIVSALICFALTPLLRKWMHPEVAEAEGEAADKPHG
ncbi:MAG: hypothetical protein HUU21_39160, partial [Polyangiaceae bacterium]|nr:hypothetical protein [Polyangiaceae bacterium]